MDLRRFRDRRRILLVSLVLAAIGHQLSHQYFFNTFAPDKVAQITAAQSLLEGHGLSIPRIDPQDFANIDYRPVVGWPPGYSLLIAIILPFVGDVWWSAVVVDACATLLFFCSWFFILESISHVMTWPTRCLVWGFWAFFITPLEGLTSSDALSLALLSGSIAFVVRYIQHRSEEIWPLMGAAALAVSSAAVRFMYWPLAAAIPIGLLYLGFRGHPRLRRAGVTLALWVAGGTVLIGAFQYLWTGHATFLTEYYGPADLAVYWRNVTRLAAFPAQALGVAEVWSAFSDRRDMPSLLSTSIIRGLSIFVLAASVIAVITARPQTDRRSGSDALIHSYVWATMSVVSGLTVGVLVCLSLLLPLQVADWTPDGYWTYVEELRYYAPVSLFLFILLSLLVQRREGVQSRVLAAATALAFLFAAAVAVSEHVREYSARVPTFALTEEAQFGRERATVMRLLRARLDAGRVVYLDSNLQLVLAAGLVGVPTFLGNASELAPVASEPVTAIVGVPRGELDTPDWQRFLSESGATPVAETFSRRLYELQLDAGRDGEVAPQL